MDNRKNKNLIVKFICILMSFGLWLYITNVENPTRKSEVKNVTVELVNIDTLQDSGLIISPNQKFTVDLKIEGPANNIYSVSKDEFKLKADIGAYALKKGENNIPVQVVNYPQGINIKNNEVLAVKVKIEDFKQKEIKVQSKVKTTFKEGFSLGSISVNPDVIKISGAQSTIDKVEVAALVGEINDIDKDLEKSFDIKLFDKSDNQINDVDIDTISGDLIVKVGKGKEVPIKPTYTGTLQDGLNINKLQLSREKITIVGREDIIDDIEFVELSPINLSSINENREFTLRLVLPEGVTVSKGEEYITVKLDIKDTKTITKEFKDIKINYTGINEKFKYEMPETASVILAGTQEYLEKITLDNIRIEANLDELVEGKHTVDLKVLLLNTDKNITIKSNSGPIVVNIAIK